MPVHDWTRVDDGTYHAFHLGWITHLSEALNDGLLPTDYYALPEQHAGRTIPDVLTLQASASQRPTPPPAGQGGLAVAEAPPQVRRKLAPAGRKRSLRRTLAIRHVSGDRLVAMVEIISPANKDRASHVQEFVDKAENALDLGIHLLIIDLFPPGTHDPFGLHGALWERFDDEPYHLPPEEPLTLASWVAGLRPEAYVEHLAVGRPLVQMPLFLTEERYVNTPLEATYARAFRGLPRISREALEK